MRLASGICPVHGMLSAGVNVGFGGCSAQAVADDKVLLLCVQGVAMAPRITCPSAGYPIASGSCGLMLGLTHACIASASLGTRSATTSGEVAASSLIVPA